jgi:hypothetical protein
MPITAAGLIVGGLGTVGKMIGRAKSNRELRALQARMPQYVKQTGLAQTLLNARAPGAAQAEANIYQQEANQMAGAQRAATSGNQLLLAGAGATGQANQAFGQLQQAEAGDYQRRYGNLTAAQQADYTAAQQQYGQQAQIQGAIQENRQNTWGDVAGLGFAAAQLGAQGAFGGGSGARQSLTPQATTVTPMATQGANMANLTQLRVPGAVAAYNQPLNIPNYLNPNALPYTQPTAQQVGGWWQQQ